MVFDRLCAVAERHWPELRPYLDVARIFEFPGRAHEVLPKKVSNMERMHEEFFMPFDTVAIEDSAGVVVLRDTEKNQVGLHQKREFIDCFMAHQSMDEFGDSPTHKRHEEEILRGIPADAMIISKGWIRYERIKEHQYAVGELLESLYCTKDKILVPRDVFGKFMETDRLSISDPEIRNAMAAIEEIMYFNTADRFVVEVTNTSTKTRGKKILRSIERPHYILLKPGEIRERAGIKEDSSPTRQSPVLHERRRHTRLLLSDKFVHKQGQKIIIPATWVGETELYKGKTKYVIMIDK